MAKPAYVWTGFEWSPFSGPKGDPGPGLTIRGLVDDQSKLPTKGDPGDGFIANDTGHIWLWSSATNTWRDSGEFRGKKGDPGETLKVSGVVANEASLPVGPALLTVFMAQDTSHLYIYDPSSSVALASGYVDLGAIAGPKGDQGVPGPVGPQGVAAYFADPVDTQLDLPVTGQPGEMRMVNNTGHVWSWDTTTSAWKDSGLFKQTGAAAHMGHAVDTVADLPAVGKPGEVRIVLDSHHMYAWDEHSKQWIDAGDFQSIPNGVNDKDLLVWSDTSKAWVPMRGVFPTMSSMVDQVKDVEDAAVRGIQILAFRSGPPGPGEKPGDAYIETTGANWSLTSAGRGFIVVRSRNFLGDEHWNTHYPVHNERHFVIAENKWYRYDEPTKYWVEVPEAKSDTHEADADNIGYRLDANGHRDAVMGAGTGAAHIEFDSLLPNTPHDVVNIKDASVISVGGSRIDNVGDPTHDHQAATKRYVDSKIVAPNSSSEAWETQLGSSAKVYAWSLPMGQTLRGDNRYAQYTQKFRATIETHTNDSLFGARINFKSGATQGLDLIEGWWRCQASQSTDQAATAWVKSHNLDVAQRAFTMGYVGGGAGWTPMQGGMYQAEFTVHRNTQYWDATDFDLHGWFSTGHDTMCTIHAHYAFRIRFQDIESLTLGFQGQSIRVMLTNLTFSEVKNLA